MRSLVILTCALSWSAVAAEHDALTLDLTDGGRSEVIVDATPWVPDLDPWAPYTIDDFTVLDFAPVAYADDVDHGDAPCPERRGSDEVPAIVLGWSAVALRKLGE